MSVEHEHVTISRLRGALPPLMLLPGAVERLLSELGDLLSPPGGSRDAAIDAIPLVEDAIDALLPVLQAAGAVARDIDRDRLLGKLREIAEADDDGELAA